MKTMLKVLSLVLVLMMTVCSVSLADAVVFGTNPEFAPFEYIGDDGVMTGIDVEIVNVLCEKVGIEVQWESMSFDALIPALISGKINAAISGMTITEDRKKSVLFTEPYFDATQVIIVPVEGATVTTEAELDGKKIGVCMGYTGDLYATSNFPNATIERYEKGMDAVTDLANGRLDAVVYDEAPAYVLAEQAGTLTVLGEKLSVEQYGIALPFGSEELCEKLNAAIAEMKEDGSLQACIDKFMGSAE